jgi:hypothetical protein
MFIYSHALMTSTHARDIDGTRKFRGYVLCSILFSRVVIPIFEVFNKSVDISNIIFYVQCETEEPAMGTQSEMVMSRDSNSGSDVVFRLLGLVLKYLIRVSCAWD